MPHGNSARTRRGVKVVVAEEVDSGEGVGEEAEASGGRIEGGKLSVMDISLTI